MDKKIIILLVVLILIFSILVRAPFKDMYKKDDALMSYGSVRYGTPDLGVTHPLWFQTLSFFYNTFNVDLVTFGLYLSWIFSFLTTLLLFPFSRLFIKNKYLALLPSFFHATNFVVGFWETTGLETSFFAFMILLTFYLYFKKEHSTNLAYIIAGIASLTRPEGIFVLLVLLFYQIRVQKGKFSESFIKSYLLPIIILVGLFVFYLFINEIPNTIMVISFFKGSMIYGITVDKIIHFIYGLGSFASLTIRYLPLAIPFALVFLFVKNKRLVKSVYEPMILLMALIILGYVFFTYNVAIRYFVPVLPFLFVFAAHGFDILSGRKKEIKAALFIAIIISLSFTWVLASHEARLEDYRLRASIETAEWLNENTPEDSLIAVYNVHGANVYFLEREIIDLVGIIRTREAFEDYWLKGIHIHEFVKKRKPDYVVISDDVLQEKHHEEFLEEFSESSELVLKNSVRMKGVGNNYGIYTDLVYKMKWENLSKELVGA